MCVAQLETPSGLKPGLQFCGNSFHSSPLERHCGFLLWPPCVSCSAVSCKRARGETDRRNGVSSINGEKTEDEDDFGTKGEPPTRFPGRSPFTVADRRHAISPIRFP